MTARPIHRAATALAAAPLLAAALTGSLAGAPAGATPAPTADRAAGYTHLTFAVDDCEGCEIQLTNARSTLDADVVRVWQSRTKEVHDGEVTFRVRPRRTWGMSVAVKAPWEGFTGYDTTLVWRYGGKHVGDSVTLDEAVTERRAAACWEGTRQRDVTVPVVVEKVRVTGQRGQVDGSIAFVPTTESWIGDMRRAYHGVLGSQDLNICR